MSALEGHGERVGGAGAEDEGVGEGVVGGEGVLRIRCHS